MADSSVTESTEIEKPRSRGRPTKHAVPHLTEDEFKVTVEGLSALKRTLATTSGLNPTCCIVVPHRLLLVEGKYYPASYISLLNESIVNHMICVSPLAHVLSRDLSSVQVKFIPEPVFLEEDDSR